jgi:hypothetical protein
MEAHTFWNRGETGLLSPRCRRQYLRLQKHPYDIEISYHDEVAGFQSVVAQREAMVLVLTICTSCNSSSLG